MISKRLLCVTIFLGLGSFGFSCSDPKEALYKMYHERVSSVGDLTDEMVVKYARTYRNLRKFGINFEKYLAENPSPQQGMKVYQDMERIMKEGGFKDFEEFVKTNAKIAWAWNMAQARRGMQKQAQLQNWGQRTIDKNIKLLEDKIRDPKIPESTKEGLRKGLEDLKRTKKELGDTYAKNLKWANWAMKLTLPLTNEKDIETVLRHERELMEVFTGLSPEQLDQINEYSMKFLENQ